MKILVTGVGGQLGYDVCKVLDARKIENKGVDLADFDITDAQATSGGGQYGSQFLTRR